MRVIDMLGGVPSDWKPDVPTPGLGRVRMPNPGSRGFDLSKRIRRAAPAAWKSKTWQIGSSRTKGRLNYRNQGSTSQCVRYGNMHILMLEPIVRFDAFQLTEGLYPWAQRNDPWSGEEPTYYGTDVDSGLRYLKNELWVIDRYDWARDMDTVLTRLSLPAKEGGGPILVGTDFYSGMDVDQPSPEERAHWEPTGSVLGGHCFVLDGHLAPTAKRSRRILIGNSHLNNFRGWMDADAMEWLLFAQGGEAAAVTEIRPAT